MALTWVIIGVLAVTGLLILYLVLWPVSINPAKWVPPKAPALVGAYAVNDHLTKVERMNIGSGVGPEDIAIDAQGRIYTGLNDGRIIRFQADESQPPETFAETGGRPLGLTFDASGNLLVADAHKGLLSIDIYGTITVLVSGFEGEPLLFANNLDIAADGTIYFSQSSTKFTLEQDMLDLLENQPNGRLYAYDPGSSETRLIHRHLYFANGVSISPDQSFLLVAESNHYRILRIWLEGSNKGKSETFIDNLPGFPDNIHHNGVDTFWVAIVSPRKPDIDRIYAMPFLRKMIVRLPPSMLPKATRVGFVLGLDQDGNVIHNLQDPSGKYAQITTAREYGGYLYLGSIVEDAICRLAL
jgi:sugar lactone lactonase YvrE